MKKIAFVKNGTVGVVLNTDESLHDFFLDGERVDVSTNSNPIAAGWLYYDGLFNPPVGEPTNVSYIPSQD